MEQTFRAYLEDHEFILHCGSTGTELMKMGGVTPGAVNNCICPEKVLALQKSYVDAGAMICITNSFSMNRIYAKDHAMGYDWREINLKSVEIAKKAAANRAFVFGNMGPIGELLTPFGMLQAEDAFDAYRDQAQLLAENGVDGFSVQTFYHLAEMKIAVSAIRSVSDLPIIASMVFGKAGATMMGDTPEKCYEELMPLGIDAFGHNCGEIDFEAIGDLLEPLAQRKELPIIICVNAGLPRCVDGKPSYDMTPAEFRAGTELLMAKGIRIIGGCCGVDLSHIKAAADLF